MKAKFVTIPKHANGARPPSGRASIFADSGVLKYWPFGGTPKKVLLDGDAAAPDVYEGEPVNYVAPIPAAATYASYDHESTADDSDLTFTAVEAGTAGNDVSITINNPNTDLSPLSVELSGTRGVVVSLATDEGDPGSVVIPTAEEGTITVTLDEDGVEFQANKSVNFTFAKGLDPFDEAHISPESDLSAYELEGTYFVLLATGAGVVGTLVLAENQGDSTAKLTISQKAAYPGVWGNARVFAQILIPAGNELAATASVENDGFIITITAYLKTDIDGDPVATTTAELKGAIDAALLAAGLDDYLETGVTAADDFTSPLALTPMGTTGHADNQDGEDPAPNDAANTAADIVDVLTPLAGIATAVASDDAHTISEEGSFSFDGAGANADITTTASELIDAIAGFPAAAALLVATLTSDGDGFGVVDALAEKTLGDDGTAGLDIGDTTPEVLGTPAVLGRLATDGTALLVALTDDNTTEQDDWTNVPVSRQVDVSGTLTGTVVKNIIAMTQAEYNALGAYDDNTAYWIIES